LIVHRISFLLYLPGVLARTACGKQTGTGKSGERSNLHNSHSVTNAPPPGALGVFVFLTLILFFEIFCLYLVNRLYQTKLEHTLKGLEDELGRREELRRERLREETFVRERSLRRLEGELSRSRAILAPRDTDTVSAAKDASDEPLTRTDLDAAPASTSRSRSRKSATKLSHVHFKSTSRSPSRHADDRPHVTFRSTHSSHRSTSSHKTAKR
jgi:hypothetical protein